MRKMEPKVLHESQSVNKVLTSTQGKLLSQQPMMECHLLSAR
jgi:hypothetical protein